MDIHAIRLDCLKFAMQTGRYNLSDGQGYRALREMTNHFVEIVCEPFCISELISSGEAMADLGQIVEPAIPAPETARLSGKKGRS